MWVVSIYNFSVASKTTLKVLLQHFNWAEIWTCSTLILFFFSHFLFGRFTGVFGLIVFLHDPICQLDGLKIASRILWANHELLCTPKSDRCPGLIAAKQAQIISCPPLCWQVVLSTNMLCLFCLFFSNMCMGVHYGQTAPLWSHLFKKCYDLYWCYFAKLNCAPMFFLERRGLLFYQLSSCHEL